MELTFWTAGVNFSINLDLIWGLILGLILVLTFNPVFSINLAGVNFLILNDAQGGDSGIANPEFRPLAGAASERRA